MAAIQAIRYYFHFFITICSSVWHTYNILLLFLLLSLLIIRQTLKGPFIQINYTLQQMKTFGALQSSNMTFWVEFARKWGSALKLVKKYFRFFFESGKCNFSEISYFYTHRFEVWAIQFQCSLHCWKGLSKTKILVYNASKPVKPFIIHRARYREK